MRTGGVISALQVREEAFDCSDEFHALFLIFRVVQFEFWDIFLMNEEFDQLIGPGTSHAAEREVCIIDDDCRFTLLDHRPIE